MEDVFQVDSAMESVLSDSGNDASARNEAIQALVALGYSASEATSAVRKVTGTEEMSVEDILKLSLKEL